MSEENNIAEASRASRKRQRRRKDLMVKCVSLILVVAGAVVCLDQVDRWRENRTDAKLSKQQERNDDNLRKALQQLQVTWALDHNQSMEGVLCTFSTMLRDQRRDQADELRLQQKLQGKQIRQEVRQLQHTFNQAIDGMMGDMSEMHDRHVKSVRSLTDTFKETVNEQRILYATGLADGLAKERKAYEERLRNRTAMQRQACTKKIKERHVKESIACDKRIDSTEEECMTRSNNRVQEANDHWKHEHEKERSRHERDLFWKRQDWDMKCDGRVGDVESACESTTTRQQEKHTADIQKGEAKYMLLSKRYDESQVKLNACEKATSYLQYAKVLGLGATALTCGSFPAVKVFFP